MLTLNISGTGADETVSPKGSQAAGHRISYGPRDGTPVFDNLSPEMVADLVVAVSLLWKSVDLLTKRIERLEAVSDKSGELVDGVS